LTEIEMRLIRAFSTLFPAALLAGSLWAQGEPAPLIRADTDYASRYVFRGIERAGQSGQASVELAQGNFRGGLWTNLPFSRGESREVDLNAAYSWHLADGVTLEGSARNYWFSDGCADGTKRSFEAGMTATLAPIDGYTPSLGYFRDVRLKSDTVQMAVARSLALTRLGTFLDLNFFAGWATGGNWRPDESGPPRHDSYGYWGAEAHLPYRVGPHSTVIAGVHYTNTRGLSRTNGPFSLSGGQNLWITLGVSLDF
jgi:hypothetical protein